MKPPTKLNQNDAMQPNGSCNQPVNNDDANGLCGNLIKFDTCLKEVALEKK